MRGLKKCRDSLSRNQWGLAAVEEHADVRSSRF